ncbi:MAG: hypothetical protein IKX06_01655 [Clostridia bacterium]|nr:hypothetical protein [Clostridia bacterium]
MKTVKTLFCNTFFTRLAAFAVSLLLLFSCFSGAGAGTGYGEDRDDGDSQGMGPIYTENAPEGFCVSTKYEKVRITDKITLAPGNSIETQIHSNAVISGIGFRFSLPDAAETVETSDDGAEDFDTETEETGENENGGSGSVTEGGEIVFSADVYVWKKNVLETIAGEAIRHAEVSAFVSAEKPEAVIYHDLSGEPLPAGEYVFRWKLTSGPAVIVEQNLPAPTGIRSYINTRLDYGSFDGAVILAEEDQKPFVFCAVNQELVYNTAPPEPELSEDSAIKTLNVDPTKWGAVDGLGRELPGNKKTGERNEKQVGIFYWTWHEEFGGDSWVKPTNLNELIKEYPEAANDFNHPAWGPDVRTNFWNEPLWGYYIESDDYVLRKQAELLADAGIDFVMFDCTNGSFTWTSAYLNLLKVWSEARADGVNTPKVAFMLQFGYSGNTRTSLWDIYTTIYRDGKYQDLWYYLDGKPLVMAWNTGLDLNNADEIDLLNFFTYRYPCASYWEEDKSDEYWGWLSTYPQTLYYNEDGTVEMTTVGVAQNANYVTQTLSAMNAEYTMGRDYAGKRGYSYSYYYRWRKIRVGSRIKDSKLYGRNFQEQWDYAISKDPDIVFVTGWNEWLVTKMKDWWGLAVAFPDEFTDNYSRDIEPTKGDLKDHYYYQLVANVRRFKGASPPDVQKKQKTIDPDAGFEQWDDAELVSYNHYAHNTLARDNKGYADTWYTGEAIRNDIVCAKVSYDSDDLYFYVETENDITPFTDDAWMRLLIDAGSATPFSKDWEGFEFILGRERTSGDKMLLEKSTGGWNWKDVGFVDYRVSGRQMMVRIPRSYLGDAGETLEFGFKWCDNNIKDGDIMTLYTEGDAAPGGRFTFRFSGGRSAVVIYKKQIIAAAVGTVLAAGIVFAVVKTVSVRKKKKAKGQAEGEQDPGDIAKNSHFSKKEKDQESCQENA